MEMISNKVVVLGSIIRVTVDSKVANYTIEFQKFQNISVWHLWLKMIETGRTRQLFLV